MGTKRKKMVCPNEEYKRIGNRHPVTQVLVWQPHYNKPLFSLTKTVSAFVLLEELEVTLSYLILWQRAPQLIGLKLRLPSYF